VFQNRRTFAPSKNDNIHGGPRAAYGFGFFHEMQYWAAQGYAVIFANPHGSSSNGNAFANLKGKFGGPDYDDLMSFVDAAIKQTDYIDPERLGVTGGSYGDPPPTRDHPLV